MGKQNRHRRAEKKRRQGGGRAAGGAHRRSASGHAGPDAAGAHLARAFEAAVGRAGGHGDLAGAIDRLEVAGAACGPLAVAELLADALARCVHECWHAGWQPADVVRAVRRHLDAATTDLVALVIDAEAAPGIPADRAVPPLWARQLDAVRHERVRPLAAAGCAGPVGWLGGAPDGGTGARRAALRAGLELLAWLHCLPALPQLLPDPCSWPRTGTAAGGTPAGASLDPATLDRVRALLAKAESTTFEAEAMAFTAKAQELMTRHAIDRAVLDREQGGHDEPEGRRLGVDDPYANERAVLLSVVAGANRCRSVLTKDLGFATVFGFGPDLDAVELLYSSLLVQATTVMAAAGSQRDAAGRSRTRAFRQSFLLGFAQRIGERLRSAADDSVEQAAARQATSTALVPLLAERDERVEEAFGAAFPAVVHEDTRVASTTGWAAGQAAAQLASVAVGEPLPR